MNRTLTSTEVEIKTCREQIQEDLLTYLDGMPPEMLNKVCQIVADNFQKTFFAHE
jgi:hypothetical protein